MGLRILAIILAVIFLCAGSSGAGLFDNKKVTQALDNGSVKVGMSKDELVSQIGYPPNGDSRQGGSFSRFAQTKVTAAGKEESWTYQIGASAEGVRSVTIKMVDGKVQEWSEWLDTKK